MLKPIKMLNILVKAICVCCVWPQCSFAVEVYIGSNADASRSIFRMVFTGTDDVTLENLSRFSKPVGGGEFSALALRPATSTLYGFVGSTVILCDLNTTEIESREVGGNKFEALFAPVAFSSSGRLLYVCSTGTDGMTGLVLDSDTLDVIATIPGSRNLVYPGAVAFSHDERDIYVATQRLVTKNPIPIEKSGPVVIDTEKGSIVAKLQTDMRSTPKCIGLWGEVLYAVDEIRNTGQVNTRVSTIIPGGEVASVDLKGRLLPGCTHAQTLISFDFASECLLTFTQAGVPQKVVPAEFMKLLPKDAVEVAYTDSGEEFTKLISVRADDDRKPRFAGGYASPDGRFVAMYYGPGIGGPSFVSIVDIDKGTASPAFKLGKLDGGISNVVFRIREENGA